MSRAASGADVRAEIGVVARSQYASVVHRPDPDAEESRPACQEADVDHAEAYREVGVETVTPHYQPCGNPACFGDDPRGQTQICVGGVADRPVRIQAFQAAVVAALRGETPLVRADVRDRLAVSEGRRGSLRRGLTDARDAGWLVWDQSEREYRRGPLARAIGGGESA